RKSPIEIRPFFGGHSSVGRAPALQAGCQGFESPCLQSPAGREARIYNGRAAFLGWAGANPLASKAPQGREARVYNGRGPHSSDGREPNPLASIFRYFAFVSSARFRSSSGIAITFTSPKSFFSG